MSLLLSLSAYHRSLLVSHPLVIRVESAADPSSATFAIACVCVCVCLTVEHNFSSRLLSYTNVLSWTRGGKKRFLSDSSLTMNTCLRPVPMAGTLCLSPHLSTMLPDCRSSIFQKGKGSQPEAFRSLVFLSIGPNLNLTSQVRSSLGLRLQLALGAAARSGQCERCEG